MNISTAADSPFLNLPHKAVPSELVRPSALQEFFAATEADAASATGLALVLAGGLPFRPILWVRQGFVSRECGTAYPSGVKEFGVDPGRIILVQVRDVAAVLQAGLEGARCAALAGVVIELWGEAKALDLTASRRLLLAAKASGTAVLMTRVAAQPCVSAAETRWQVRSASSRALAANAPGNPAVRLDLLRHRGGAPLGTWHLEWNRDTRSFNDRASSFRLAPSPPLSGAVVSISADGSAAPGRIAARHAG